MIDKREIIDAASALGLNPHVVEKDYVLGWLLWGIHSHDALRESWIFKGGTCLKHGDPTLGLLEGSVLLVQDDSHFRWLFVKRHSIRCRGGSGFF